MTVTILYPDHNCTVPDKDKVTFEVPRYEKERGFTQEFRIALRDFFGFDGQRKYNFDWHIVEFEGQGWANWLEIQACMMADHDIFLLFKRGLTRPDTKVSLKKVKSLSFLVNVASIADVSPTVCHVNCLEILPGIELTGEEARAVFMEFGR